ncbi:MAG: deoxyribose-phosphate aldolase [Halobacteriales archaeon]
MDLTERLRSSPSTVAELIEHTNVDPRSRAATVDALCDEVLHNGFRAAVVVPYHAERVARRLDGRAATVAVVGFPYGVQPTPAKRAEVEAVAAHVDEVDMVMQQTAFHNGDLETVRDDVAGVKAVAGDRPLKCIIESPVLKPAEIRTAASTVAEAGADVVKTAVGYDGPTDPEEVRHIREAVGDDVGVKASGGIADFETAIAMVEAGATHIGTSSGVSIVDSIDSSE